MKSGHFELYECMHRFQRLSFSIALTGISHSEFFMLKTLIIMRGDDNIRVTVSDLASEIDVSSPAVSRRLKSLEEKELVERVIDRSNRRNTYVIVTPKGVRTILNAEKMMCAFMKRVKKSIGDEELNDIIRRLNKLIGVMEAVASEMEAEGINAENIEVP